MPAKLQFGEWHIIAAPRTPQSRLTPVGACIYCGQSDGLTDEHIIPDGVGGDLILPAASCGTCQKKIKPWEFRVQKRNLGATREASGVRSRKRRGRNKGEDKRLFRAVAAAVKEGEDPRDEDRGPEILDPDGLPRMVLTEITLGRPEMLGGVIPGNGICVATAARTDTGPTEYSIDFWAKGGDFLRLVAKIAHGFAVAILGTDAFEPYLVDIILDHKHDDADLWRYIGGQSISTNTDELHRVRIVDDLATLRTNTGLGIRFEQVYVAHIQLFANCSGPIYEVVVGRKRIEQ